MHDILLTLGGVSLAIPLLASHASKDTPFAARLRAARLKLKRQLPEVSWLDLLLSAYPGSLASRGVKAARQTGAIAGTHVSLVRREKDPLCPVLWSTPSGNLWGRFIDGEILNYIASEMYDDLAYEQGGVAINEGDVVFDLGGHLGLFTSYALSRGAARVVVFEADPRNVACLRKSLAEVIAAGRVEIVEAAAWSEETELVFAGAGEADNSSVSQISDQGNLKVRATTIDRVMNDLGLERLDFIKMDIEGAERHALVGAKTSIARYKPQMALSIYHLTDDPQVIPDLVLETAPGYRVVRHTEQAYFTVPS
jgi:FkbM family methyltransferase